MITSKKNGWKKVIVFGMEFYADYHFWEEDGVKKINLVCLTNVQSGVKTRFENGFIKYREELIPVLDYVMLSLGYKPEPLKEEKIEDKKNKNKGPKKVEEKTEEKVEEKKIEEKK